MTSAAFVAEATEILRAAGGTQIEVLDYPKGTDFFVGVACTWDGTRYEQSFLAPSEAFRVRARDQLIESARRFARERG